MAQHRPQPGPQAGQAAQGGEERPAQPEGQGGLGDVSGQHHRTPAFSQLVGQIGHAGVSGAQGGGAKDVIGAFDEKGLGAIVNSSRAVLTAWQKQNRPGSEYAAAARDEAIRMRDDITQYLPEIRL